MNLAQVSEALHQAFATAWAASAFASAPIDFENELFTPPDGSAPWVRLTISEFDTRQKTMGVAPNRRWRRDVNVFVQCFAPVEGSVQGMAGNGGSKKVAAMAEVARRCFEGKTISTAKFRAATVGNARLDPDSQGRWIMRLVTAPFFFMETA